ncbi:MAG: Hsp33 family molecular chaperone HslO, partial [Gemmatimonadales bacterium]
LIQLLPGVPDEDLAALEARVAALPHPTELIRSGVTPEQMLEALFPEGFELLERYPVSFHCPCSRDRFERAIVSLGEDEVRRIVLEEEQPYTEVVCHFCNEAYHFTPVEMREILDAAA